MTKDERDLWLKDLCGRLPYGVKCHGFQMKIDGNDNECYGVLKNISNKDSGWEFMLSDRVPLNNKKCYQEDYHEVKPYLFPLFSLTAEQKRDLTNLFNCTVVITEWEIVFPNYYDSNMDNWNKVFNWCYKNHFDINGLIPMGLAIDATNLNIYDTRI